VVIQGAVLVLKMSGLTASPNSCANEYKDGKIALAGGVLKAACAGAARRVGRFGIPGIPGPVGDAASGSRPFVKGEKLDVTKIEIKDKDNFVAFSLVSDPINNVIYKAEMRLPFPKGSALDFAQTDKLASEVFDIQAEQSNQQQTGGPAPAAGQAAATVAAPPAAAPTPEPLAPIAPPPPPPDAPAAPPPTVSLGMTFDQVVGIMGQPKSIADVGTKKIYTYNGIKITFVDGKVSDIQ